MDDKTIQLLKDARAIVRTFIRFADKLPVSVDVSFAEDVAERIDTALLEVLK